MVQTCIRVPSVETMWGTQTALSCKGNAANLRWGTPRPSDPPWPASSFLLGGSQDPGDSPTYFWNHRLCPQMTMNKSSSRPDCLVLKLLAT